MKKGHRTIILALLALLLAGVGLWWMSTRNNQTAPEPEGQTASTDGAAATATSRASTEPAAASSEPAATSAAAPATSATHGSSAAHSSSAGHAANASGVPHSMPRPRPEPTWAMPGMPIPDKVVTAYPELPVAKTARDDIENLAILLGQFRRVFKENPPGGHLDIVASLQGANSRGLATLDPGKHKFSKHGELLDRFGTPYFFHAESAKDMEIRSAGPDKKMYTDDDLVTRP